MLPNEIFALGCRAWYEEQGLVVDASNGQFAHSPLTKRECDTGYYLLWEHHQHQGLLQSKDLNKCCFFVGHTLKWLKECDYFPEGYFELWDIYEEYSSKQGEKNAETGRKNGTGFCDPEFQKKLKETNRKNGTGVFDPEVRKMGIEALRKNKAGVFDPKVRKMGREKSMKINRENGTGIYDPEVRKMGIETLRKNRAGVYDPEVRRKADEANKKPIELTKIETGEKFVFPSKKDAARALNLRESLLSIVCHGKRKQTGGFTARYL